MLDLVSLRKTGTVWEFASEAALEDFVWLNLPQLFGLTPLKRQYSVDGQFCDILALGENQELVVLELKNVEDRYVVQQLTRYYHALCEAKAFSEQINSEKPVHLIAVAPSFHRDNLIDRKYNQLSIKFFLFKIIVHEGCFFFYLKDLDQNKVSQLSLNYREVNYKPSKENLPEPPRLLLDWLGLHSIEHQKKILQIREKILGFDRRMKEISDSKKVIYGKGKTKQCAEFSYNKKLNQIILFLWLPIPERSKQAIGRMQVPTDWSFYWKFSHVPEGFYNTYKNSTYVLQQAGKDSYTDLNYLIDDALDTWQNRL